jgi:Xaa-Pro dipeptidase
LPTLGFQLKERPWQEPSIQLIEDVCRGRNVASDTGVAKTTDVGEQIRAMRRPLTLLECERMRELGSRVAHAVEATARHCWRGETESQIAGQVAHRLVKHQIQPERIQVWADRHGERYRHWGHGDNKLDRFCMISAVGRKWGLCVAASRTVCFGAPPRELQEAYHKAVLMQATGMFFSQPQWKLFEVWNRVHRIYEKFGVANEWRLCDQGEVIGYEPCEVPVLPNSEFHITPRMALCWHPSVGPAYICDTVLVGTEHSEAITNMSGWPMLKVEVKGTPMFRPEILQREWYDNQLENLLGGGRDEHGDSILMKRAPEGGSGSGPISTGGESILDDADDQPDRTESGGDSIFD